MRLIKKVDEVDKKVDKKVDEVDKKG